MAWRRWVAVGLVAALAACTAPEDRDPRIEGEWQSVGYGRLVEIDRDAGTLRLTSWDRTASSCLGGESMEVVGREDGWTVFGEDGERELLVRGQGDDRLIVEEPGSAGVVHLDRLDDPPTCPTAVSEDPEARRLQTFDAFWDSLEEHYPPYPHRRLDASDRTRDRATLVEDNTDAVLGSLLDGAVRDLGDMHTGLESEDHGVHGLRPGTRDSADLDTAAFRPAIEARLGTGLTTVVDDAVEYAGGLPGDLGYLRITRLDDLTDGSYEDDREEFEEALDTVFDVAEDEEWRGLVLDLRLNDGGFDALGLELASRLTREPHVAFRKRARDPGAASGFTPFQEVEVEPGRRPGFDGPVALLVSDLTVSAGETTAAALLNRSPRPTLIGRPTQGVFSDQLSRALPGGWVLDLSNEDYRDAGGRSHEGRGLPVSRTFRTPVFTDAEISGRCDSALARALDHLTGEPAGTTPPCRPSGG